MSQPHTHPRARGRHSLLAFSGLALLLGCSGFEKRWKGAAQAPVEVNDITGRWQGHWVSDATGHTGGLRCIITREGAGDGTGGANGGGDAYRADFHATYARFLTFGYEMHLDVTRRDETNTYFQGEADLGWLAGGVYRYEGRAGGDEFLINYRAKKDYGHFRLHRPGGPAPAERIAGAGGAVKR